MSTAGETRPRAAALHLADLGIALVESALAAPESLPAVAEAAVTALPGNVTVVERQAFRPAPPRPEQHFDHVIA